MVGWLVGWSLTSLSSTNTATSETTHHTWKNVTALPCEMQNFFIWLKTEVNVAFHHVLLKFSPCCNKTLPQLGLVLDTRALAAAKLDCTNLIFVEPGAKINGHYRDVLLMHYSDSQHCWRRICLPARQCASTSCSWHSRAISAQWDTAVHQSWHLWPANSPDLNPVNYRIWGLLL